MNHGVTTETTTLGRDPKGSRWLRLVATLALLLAVLPARFLGPSGGGLGDWVGTDHAERAALSLDRARSRLALLPEQERERSADPATPALGLPPRAASGHAAGRLETADPALAPRLAPTAQRSAHRPRGPPTAALPTIG